MAKVSGPLMSNHASGSVAKAITIRSTKHGSVVTGYHFPGSKKKVSVSTAQAENRAKYAAALTSWQALSTEEKAQLDIDAGSVFISGWNIHLRNAMQTKYMVSDDFNRPNNSILEPPWILSYNWRGWRIISAQARPITGDTNTRHTMLYNDMFANNQWMEVVVANPGSTGSLDFILRADPNGSGMYWRADNTFQQIRLFTEGSFVVLETINTPNLKAGDVVRFQVSGNTYTGFVNGIQVFTTSHPGRNSGLPGIYSWRFDTRLDNFSAGDL